MTDLHKLVLVFLGTLLHLYAFAISNTTYIAANASPPIVFTCPSDSLEITIQSTATCSRTPIEFQTNLLTTNLKWDYGDGSSDNGLANGHATHIYLETGNYTVQVMADYGDGCTETQTIQLKVVTSELDFTYQIIDKTVTFTAITNEFTAVDLYKWTLGDGAAASGLTPSTIYTYRNNGEYIVSLVGEGDCAAAPTTKTIVVGAAPIPEDSPTACNDGIDNDGDGKIDCADSECECICTSGAFGCCDNFTAKVNLIHATPGKMDGSIEVIPSGGSDKAENYQISWSITPAPTGFTATNLAPGNYTLEVIDIAYGCTLFIDRTITEDACRTTPILANVDVSNSASCDNPSGEATVNHLGGASPYEYLWSNGATNKSVFNLAAGTQHVSITDANGCETIVPFEMPSTNQPVTAIFDYTLTADSILFRDLSVGPVDSKQWTFNTPSLILNNRTPLPPAGNYEICLIINNECGGTSKSCQTVGIAPACAAEVLGVTMIDAQSEYCIRAPILFETNVVAEHYTWYFGDANTFTGTESSTSGSNLNTTSHIYYEAANPSVKLVVDYGNGCLDSTAIDLSIISTDADFSYTIMDDSAQFIADSSAHTTDFQWTFSGPNTATTAYGSKVNFVFPTSGEYTVSLMPIGTCSAFITQKIVLFASDLSPENTPRACSDGIDNDGDGLLDCEDNDCICETCPTDIEFFSQIQIDNFPISYPECTVIEGNVTIQSLDSDITNLEALGQLTAIGGTLLVVENPDLASLAGLDNITTLGGDLEIDQNPLLTNFYGLNKLSSIDGTFAIGEQTNLSQLFNSNTLFSIGGDFLLYGDTKLQNLNSLNTLLLLGGSLELTNQSTLQSLQGLENIGDLGGSLLLTNNAQLNSLTALSPITGINGELNVSNNPMLTGLEGLENISSTSITKITIQSSTALSYCAVTSVCDFLNAVGTAKISGNATGCSTTQEVIANCSDTPTPPLFTEFPWLNNTVNPSNCSSEKITKYLSNANQIFVFVETANSAVLYNSSGQTWCTNTSNYECRDFYSVIEVLEVWECGTTTDIDADMDGTPASTDPDDNDPCVPDNTVANCNDGSTTDADMDGTPASTDPDDNDPCVPDNTVANCNTGGGTIPDFYTDYPWLNDLVDPLNCTNEKITIYKSSGFIYLAVETSSSLVLYNAQGTRYCSNGIGLNCLEYYQVDEIIETWTCGTITTPIDADMDGTPAATDPDDNDPCVPDNTVANCDTGSTTDADMDGTPASTDPDDNDPCVPDNTVANCNTGGGTVPDFFEDYPWLSTYVDPTNCSDEKITIYKSSGYIYLAIESGTSLILYSANGTRYCTSGVGLNCLEYYTVDEVLETWECGEIASGQIDEDMDGVLVEDDPDDADPCVPNKNAVTCETDPVGERPIIFTDYPWLTDYIDPTTCSTSDSIIVYRSSGYVYLYIKTSESSILYSANGTRYCSDGVGLNCLEYYQIDEYINIWTCQENPNNSIDKDMDGTPAATDPDDNDPCVPDNTVANCNTGGTIDADMDGTPAATDPDDNDPCVPDNTVANCNTNGGEIPSFFEEYTWLSTLVDPTNCTDEKITIYTSSGYTYLAIETATSLVLYSANGTRYCSNGVGLNCLEYYQIDEVLETWECGTNTTPVDLDMDGTPSNTDPDDNDPCVPDNTVANCNDGSTTDADMDGTPAATDPDDNDPCVPDNTVANCNTTETTPAIFTEYTWLSSKIDPNNCKGDAVTVYRSSGYVYLFIESGNTGILYSANGTQYCVSASNYDCTALYKIDEILDTWSCTSTAPIIGDCSKNVGNIRLINCSDGTPFFFIELPNGTILDPYFEEGLSFDYFDGQTVNFDFYYADFFSPCNFVQGTIILTCIEQSEECNCPDTDLPVCGADGITYQNTCEAQCAGVEILSETECGSNTPNFFTDFPWLFDLVDPTNCTTEKVTVYRTGFYQYIWVETTEGKKMYFQDGTLYCTEVPEFDCIAAYQLDRIDYQWFCSSAVTTEGLAQSRNALIPNTTLPTKKELEGFSIFPNPSRGTFFIELTTTTFPQTVSLMDISGQVFKVLPVAATDSGTKEVLPIDITSVSPGIYFIQVASEHGVQTQRLVVE